MAVSSVPARVAGIGPSRRAVVMGTVLSTALFTLALADPVGGVSAQDLWRHQVQATGLSAWFLGLASTGAGAAMAVPGIRSRVGGKGLLRFHRTAAALTVVYTAVHVLGVAVDHAARFGPHVLVDPLAEQWNRVALTAGLADTILLGVVELSSLTIRRTNRRQWRTLHSFAYLGTASASVHVLTAGGGPPAGLAAVAVVTAAASAAAMLRALPVGSAAQRTPRQPFPDLRR